MQRFNYFGLIKNAKIRKVVTVFFVFILIFSVLGVFFFRPRTAFADATLGFDEGYGTTTNDSNNTVSGTITNALWRTDELCFDGKCLYFDGSGDFVSFGDDPDLDYAGASNFTLEGWFRTPDITSGQRTIIAKYNSATGTDGGYKVYMDSSGYVIFGIDDDQTSFPEDSVSTTTTAFDDNKWHHFAAVKTGTTSITLYIDGNQYQTDSSLSASGTLVNTDAFYIGIDGDGSSNGYSGFIDQVKVYNTARTASEIKADIAGNTTNRGVSAAFGGNQSFLSNGLVGYWKMDETASPTLDSSGNGNSGTWNNTPTTTTGKFGPGVYFDTATTNKYISVPAATSIDNLSAFTISTWVNPSELQSTTIFSKGWPMYLYFETISSGLRTQFGLQCTGDDMNAYATSVDNMTLNTWHHVVVTWDGSSCLLNSLNVYIDGKIIEKHVNSDNGTGTKNSDSANALSIGNHTSSLTTEQVHGSVDETRLYNRAMTPAEVSQLYKWAPGPVAHWKLDENTGTTTYDSSGNGNTSTTWTGTNTWATGKFGSALNFNNSDGVVRFAETATTTDLGNADSYTVSAWVKTSDTSASTDDVVAKHGTNGGAAPFRIYLSATTRNAGIVVTDGTNSASFTGTAALNDNKWHHVVAVRDVFTDTIYLYVDGTLANSATDPTSGSVANNDDISIGNGRASYTTDDLNGNVDDVRVYNYARTQAQIIEDMNAGHPAPGSPVGSAVSYWAFDEGYGTSANDSSVNANTLTLSTASWTNSSKFGKAFNGLTNVRLSRADDSDFDFVATDDLSFSVWFKSDSATNPSANEYILEKGGNIATDAIGYAIYTSAASDGLICFGIDDDATTFPEDSVCSTSDLYDATWHHIVATKTGTSRLDLFVDGKPNGTPDTAISSTGTLANSATFYLGDTNGTDGTDEFLGDLDEIRIYRSALSLDQVKAEYAQGSGTVMGALSTDSSGVPSWSANDEYCPPGQGSTCTPPIALWNMDENTGTTIYDISGNGYNGTFQDSLTASDWTWGKLGSAVSFVGANKSIIASHSTAFDFGTSTKFTIGLWFKITADTASQQTLIAPTGLVASGVEIYSGSDGKIRAAIGSGTYCSIRNTGVAVEDGKWHYLEAVFNRGSGCTTSSTQIYIDGLLEPTVVADSSGGADADINVGGVKFTSSSTNDSVVLDNVKIYNYDRTPSQVAWDYNRGTPIAHWQMDESSWNGTANEVKDASGNSSHGVRSGDATTATGKINNAGTFDGNGDYVTISNESLFDIENDDSFSVGAWVKPTSYSSCVICKMEGSGNFRGWGLMTSVSLGNNVFQFNLRNGSGNEINLETTKAFDTGRWYHILATYDGSLSSNGVKLYVDGVSQGLTVNSDTLSGTILQDISPQISGRGGSGFLYTGLIDDARVYNYVLTSQQVKTVMNDGSAIKFTQ